MLGCSGGVSRKRISAMRRIADIDAVGVVLTVICSCSSGDRESETVLDRRKVDRDFMVISDWLMSF